MPAFATQPESFFHSAYPAVDDRKKTSAEDDNEFFIISSCMQEVNKPRGECIQRLKTTNRGDVQTCVEPTRKLFSV